MKKTLPVPASSSTFFATLAVLCFSFIASPVQAATSTWSGGATDSLWSRPANWNSTPLTNDSVIFTGTTRLLNTNDFAAGKPFGSISFAQVAGGFNLYGNVVALGGGMTTLP